MKSRNNSAMASVTYFRVLNSLLKYLGIEYKVSHLLGVQSTTELYWTPKDILKWNLGIERSGMGGGTEFKSEFIIPESPYNSEPWGQSQATEWTFLQRSSF